MKKLVILCILPCLIGLVLSEDCTTSEDCQQTKCATVLGVDVRMGCSDHMCSCYVHTTGDTHQYCTYSANCDAYQACNHGNNRRDHDHAPKARCVHHKCYCASKHHGD